MNEYKNEVISEANNKNMNERIKEELMNEIVFNPYQQNWSKLTFSRNFFLIFLT